MTVKWQPENAAGTLWSATVADRQQGWFEIQMERSPDGWVWVINHDRRFWGQENTLEQAKIAVAAQLEQTGQHFPRCEIRPFTENEGDGYLISFPDLPGVVASGAMPEEAIRRVRDALDVFRSTMRRAEIPKVDGQVHAREGRLRSAIRADRNPLAILRIAASANQQIGRSRTKPDARTSQENGIAIPTPAALLDQERHELTAEAAY